MLKWIALVLVLVMAPYFWASSGLQDLDEQARVELGGDYLAAPQGVLSYIRQGSRDAPVVILVHGFSTPKFVWEQVTPVLVASGYQVISFDHLGRGFSERPPGPYDAALYRSELSALIDGLGLATPVALVGYSMGGANVVDFAAANPALVSQLVLIAPAGYMGESSSAALLKIPAVGEWVATVLGKHYALSSIKSEVAAGVAPADMLEKFEKQASYKGYSDALLSTLRHFPMGEQRHRYRAVGVAAIPVTAIWGTHDQVVPYSGAALMLADVPHMQLVTLDQGNHNITYVRPQEVAVAVVAALDAAR